MYLKATVIITVLHVMFDDNQSTPAEHEGTWYAHGQNSYAYDNVRMIILRRNDETI